MWWNPLLHITALVRMGFYATYRPDFISLTYTLGFGLLLILVGLIFIPPNFQKILEK
jgi:capsular polysaccharide transport system permease protein